MTDTGRIPGEGLPENGVGVAVHQPLTGLPGDGVPQQSGWGTDPLTEPLPPGFAGEVPDPGYPYLEQPAAPGAEIDDEDDVLLMPGPQGSWSDPQPVPPQPPIALPPEAVAPTAGPADPAGGQQPAAAPRRPLHLGPPIPDTPSGGVSVRSLADRGPAVRASGPPTAGPEYLDLPQDAAAAIPAQQTGDAPGPAVPVPGSAWPAASAVSQQSLIPHADSVIPAQGAFPAAPAEQIASGAAAAPVVPAPVGAAAPAEVAVVDPTPPVPVESVQVKAPVEEPPFAAPAAQPVPEDLPLAQSVAPAPAMTAASAGMPVPLPAAVVVTAAPAPAPAEAPVGDTAAVGEPAVEPVADASAPAVVVAVQQPPVAAESPADPRTPTAASVALDLADTPPAGTPIVAEGPWDTTAAGTPEAEPREAAAVPAEVPAAEPSAVPAEPVSASVPTAAEPAVAVEQAPEEPVPAGGQGTGRRRGAPASVPESSVPAEPAPESSVPAEPASEPVVEAEPAPAVVVAVEPGPGTVVVEPGPAAEPDVPQSAAAEAYEPAVRDAVHRVIRERRDIRNGFRSDPIPHDVLLRVLEAAHTAPSVGHSQPWDFVVIRSAKTREKMHELAMRQREAYAKTLPKGRARQFRELKIEAILDTPVNIVVTADSTRGGRHTLGRHTQPQMAPYSSALAVENLWLAARAEGLGVGWVSFFDERQMVAELALPEHLEVVAYLCVGYVDEFPDEPELMQAGWSKRRPLSWVVHDEEYGNRALPGEEPHDLLEETLRGIRPLDAKALGEAWERQKRMTKPPGSLGMLEIISAQLSGLSRECPPPIPEPAAVAIFAGDHGVHAQGVTAWPQEVTAQMVANFLGGGAVCNAFANQVGAEVCVIDVGVAAELPTQPGLLPRKVRMGTADFTAGPAMSRDEALRAVEVGIETARDLVAAGNKALLAGEMGIANTTASAALIAVFTGADPAEVTGRGTGINDEMHARKVEVVRRALDLHQPDPADPIGVLAAVGGLEHAAMVGLLLGAAALRTPVILDGVSAGAAALVARAVAPEVLAACIAGHRSAEPGHVAALTTLGLRPLIDLDLRLGEGTGALLALPLVQSAARVMHEVATFDAAGVTEKG
jgi:nicotinate-nucleotide--dimethylbenzimidazole phosphoribosyltransferase